MRDADSSPSGGSAVRNDPRNDGERAGSGDHLTQPEYESFGVCGRWGEGQGGHGRTDVKFAVELLSNCIQYLNHRFGVRQHLR